jgi:hypothetical protein
VRDVVFPAAGGEQKLHDLVREYKSSGPAFRFQVHTYLRATYAAHYRRMVPHLLQALEFRSNNAIHRPLIEALQLLKRYATSSQRLLSTSQNQLADTRLDRIFLRRRMFMPTRGLLAAPR